MRALFFLLFFTSLALGQVKVPGGLFGDGENDEGKTTKFDGVWRSDAGPNVGFRHFSYGGVYNLTYANRASGIIEYHAIGRFKEADKGLLEAAKYTTDNWSWLRKPIGYQTIFEGEDILALIDPENKKNVWVKRTADANQKTLDGVVDFSTDRTALDGVWKYDGMSGKIRYRAILIYDRGRFSNTHIEFETKRASRHMIGLYSLTGDVARLKVLYATENWKNEIGKEEVARIEYQGARHRQINGSGWTADWTLVGKLAAPELGKALAKAAVKSR